MTILYIVGQKEMIDWRRPLTEVMLETATVPRGDDARGSQRLMREVIAEKTFAAAVALAVVLVGDEVRSARWVGALVDWLGAGLFRDVHEASRAQPTVSAPSQDPPSS